MKRKWINEKVTVLGLSLSGIASAKYLNDKGAVCTISEKRPIKPEDSVVIQELNHLGIQVEMGEHKEDTIINADMIIASPGIPPHAEVIQIAKKHKVPVIGEIELAYIETSKPFIAITGTNGKTTTTKLVSEILMQAGFNAPVCGNIGVPAIGLIDDESIDYLVAEVSSFQIDTSPTFKPQIAVFINYTPDHIDWHGSAEAYFEAKANLFIDPKSPSWIVLNACDPKVFELRNRSLSEVIPFGRAMPGQSVYVRNDRVVLKDNRGIHDVIALKDIPLIGKHNLQNIMAAIAVANLVGVDNNSIKTAIMSFRPPEHRLEYVDTIDGIAYYNDSKATNCDSAICALNAFDDQKVVLIAGGRDKGTDLTDFVNAIKEYASAVILIGEATDRFHEALSSSGYLEIHRAGSLEQAIDIAGGFKSGPVLFAPACASFDMFKNYEERGRAFKDYVIKKRTLSPA